MVKRQMAIQNDLFAKYCDSSKSLLPGLHSALQSRQSNIQKLQPIIRKNKQQNTQVPTALPVNNTFDSVSSNNPMAIIDASRNPLDTRNSSRSTVASYVGPPRWEFDGKMLMPAGFTSNTKIREGAILQLPKGNQKWSLILYQAINICHCLDREMNKFEPDLQKIDWFAKNDKWWKTDSKFQMNFFFNFKFFNFKMFF